MSDIVPAPATESPESLAAVLVEEAAITLEISEQELRALQASLQEVIESAEAVSATLRNLAGPNPGRLPQHLLTMLQLGTGYLRHNRDTLRMLFRERSKVQPKETT